MLTVWKKNNKILPVFQFPMQASRFPKECETGEVFLPASVSKCSKIMCQVGSWMKWKKKGKTIGVNKGRD